MRKLIVSMVVTLTMVLSATSVLAYLVVPNDTLSQIGSRFGMSVDELLGLNPQIEDPNLIHVGENINTGGQTLGSSIAFFDKLAAANEEIGIFGVNIGFVQVQDQFLAGSGITASVTTIDLTEFKFPNGQKVITADFGTIGYGTLEPNTSREENISFTTITQNGDGTASLTGVARGLEFNTPYTASSTLEFAHAGGTLFRITNSAPFYNELLAKKNDETIIGVHTFEVYPVASSSLGVVTTSAQFATKQYVDDTTNQGAATSSETVSGISELATQIETASSTFNGVNFPLVLQARYATSSPNTVANPGLFTVITENDGFINQLFLDLTELWSFTDLFATNATITDATITADLILGTSVFDAAPTSTGLTLIGESYQDGNSTTTGRLNFDTLCATDDNCVTSLDFITASSTGALLSITGVHTATGFATTTLLANSMGANGSVVVRTYFDSEDTGGSEDSLSVGFGATDVCSGLGIGTADADGYMECRIDNLGATNSQAGSGWLINNPDDVALDGRTTSAIDTTADVDIVVRFSADNASDTISLEGYSVDLYFRP